MSVRFYPQKIAQGLVVTRFRQQLRTKEPEMLLYAPTGVEYL